MNQYFLSLSTSIEERSKILKNPNAENDISERIKNQSLLNKEDLNCLFEYSNMSRINFGNGIKEITIDDMKLLFDKYVKTSDWYRIFLEIFSLNEIEVNITHETAFRHFKDYFLRKIKNFPLPVDISIKEVVYKNAADDIIADLLDISLKTLVWDVHDIIEREDISTDTPEIEFEKYILKRFGDNSSTMDFFIEYPMLTKLLITRLKFHIDNFNNFLSSIIIHKLDIVNTFNLDQSLTLDDYSSMRNDSHDNGKTTIFFKLNNKKLVYKYKNLEIADTFQSFQYYVHKLYPDYRFVTINRYTSDSFTIEEFIDYKSCESEKELHEYFKNYGYLLVVCYWLNSKDLHMENLISHGKYPVVIDLETIISPDIKSIYEIKNANQKIRYCESKSLRSSGLLPTKEFLGNHLEISALEGNSYTLKNVPQPINLNKSNVIYKKSDLTIPPSSNLPKLKENAVHYKKYTSDIINGFLKLNSVFLRNKSIVSQKILQLFSNKNVRIILRDTSQYGEFIDYACHPSCTTDSLDREKVFENLWTYPLLNKNPILHETSSLYNNDIPYFYSNSSDKDLYSNQGVIQDYFHSSVLNGLEEHIHTITRKSVESELLFIKNSMGILRPKDIKINIDLDKKDYLKNAITIEQMIKNHLIIGDDKKGISWYSTLKKEEGSFHLAPSTNSLYDGKTGLYLFYLYLNHLAPNAEYKYILDCLENDIFERNGNEYRGTAFYGEEAKVYPALCAYRITKKYYYKRIIEECLSKIYKRKNYHQKTEWIHGSGGLLKVLYLIYKELKIDLALEIIKEIVTQLNRESYSKKGFAHGDIGAYYSLEFAKKVIPSRKISKILNSILQDIKSTDLNKLSSSWCSGSYGYLLFHHSNKDIPIPIKLTDNISLCHGISSIIDLLINLYNQRKISSEYYLKEIDKLLQHIAIYGRIENPINIGLFNGITGLGYEFLRLSDKAIPSVLVFD